MVQTEVFARQARRILVLALFLSFFCRTVWALTSGPDAVIRLKDGSIIKGQVLGKDGDKYRILSSSLGLIAVKDSDVVSLEEKQMPEKPPAPAQASPGPLESSQAQQIQGALLDNPQTVKSIQDLSQDKDVLDIVSDPQIKDAIARQDLEYLRNNEKFLKFMENPSVKEVVQSAVQAVESSPQQGADDGRQSQN